MKKQQPLDASGYVPGEDDLTPNINYYFLFNNGVDDTDGRHWIENGELLYTNACSYLERRAAVDVYKELDLN